jgi:fermentation-respiration switch protein FrsA (DUF1100 family)
VEPAPETVDEPLPEPAALFDELLDELELPHAARPSASKATLASAPILFLVTTSPLAGLRVVGAGRADKAPADDARSSLLIARDRDVNIS